MQEDINEEDWNEQMGSLGIEDRSLLADVAKLVSRDRAMRPEPEDGPEIEMILKLRNRVLSLSQNIISSQALAVQLEQASAERDEARDWYKHQEAEIQRLGNINAEKDREIERLGESMRSYARYSTIHQQEADDLQSQLATLREALDTAVVALNEVGLKASESWVPPEDRCVSVLNIVEAASASGQWIMSALKSKVPIVPPELEFPI